jgi:hypothetical protein
MGRRMVQRRMMWNIRLVSGEDTHGVLRLP